MKKTAALLLLSVYIIIQAVTVCWHFYKPLMHSYFLQQAQDNTAAGNNALVSITIDKDELNQLRNNEGEIVIDEVLYDIETTVATGNMLQVVLKRDSDETDWNDHYKKITNLLYKHIGERHATSGKTFFTLLPLFCYKETTTNLYLVRYLHKISQRTSALFFPGPVKELITPPPRSC